MHAVSQRVKPNVPMAGAAVTRWSRCVNFCSPRIKPPWVVSLQPGGTSAQHEVFFSWDFVFHILILLSILHLHQKGCVFRGSGGEVVMPSCRCAFHAATTNVMDSSTTIVGSEEDSGEDRVMEEEESGERECNFCFYLPCVRSVHILHLS